MASILGGNFQSKKIDLDSPADFRPTSVMLKRKLFDRFQTLEDYIFVDLCAGSAQVGLEALSRGANRLILVEKNKVLKKLIQKNMTNMHMSPELFRSVEVFYCSFDEYLSSQHFKDLIKSQAPIMLFFDPPYEQINLYEDFFKRLEKLSLSPLSYIVVEFCRVKTLEEQKMLRLSSLKLIKSYKQGTSFIHLYETP